MKFTQILNIFLIIFFINGCSFLSSFARENPNERYKEEGDDLVINSETEDLEISNEMAGLYSDIFTQSSFGIHTYETFSIVVRGKIKRESLTRISTDETSESFSFETNLPNRFASKTTWYKK